jgi:hypothetical protein
VVEVDALPHVTLLVGDQTKTCESTHVESIEFNALDVAGSGVIELPESKFAHQTSTLRFLIPTHICSR